jgi:hypothetical protein
MRDFSGSWKYESFCPLRGTGGAEPQIAAPWSPRGNLEVKTDTSTGKVSGSLSFAPGVVLAISGVITPAANGLAEGIELRGEGLGSVSLLRGYFISGRESTMIVGSVVAVQNDLAKQPVGTSGPFVIYM